MSLLTERKIDCHNHIFDPTAFPYQPDSPYHPTGHEVATADYFHQVLDCYGVSHALLIGPNSGYGENDNRALLDAIKRSGGRFKGMAVVDADCSSDQLAELKAGGVVGATFNVAFYGPEHFLQSKALLARLAELDMIAQVQVSADQLLPLAAVFGDAPTRLVIDHCGRPDLQAGIDNPGFNAVLKLAESGRSWIKVSGFEKFSQQPYPYADCLPYVRAMQSAFGEDRLLWGSDWPFLKPRQRMDYGTVLMLAAEHFPDAAAREKYFWENAAALYDFDA